MSRKQKVYFLEYPKTNTVKIGYTGNNVRNRIIGVKSESGISDVLILMGTMQGGRQLEQKIHRVLAHYRKRGEWFSLQPEVRRFIETCIAKNDVEVARAVHGDIIHAEVESANHRLYEWDCYEERGLA